MSYAFEENLEIEVRGEPEFFNLDDMFEITEFIQGVEEYNYHGIIMEMKEEGTTIFLLANDEDYFDMIGGTFSYRTIKRIAEERAYLNMTGDKKIDEIVEGHNAFINSLKQLS